jgi:hypothetical protein
MIASFFQSLDRHGVEYLLISGQAAILYGAATFSEDIDLWVNPSAENRDRLLAALRLCGARYYKLTPPLTVEHLARGHGFHFIIPAEPAPELFLDVMGAPPRVASFRASLVSARRIETEWGPLPTIGLKDLVELKKTQRLEDYAVISNLALAWFDQPECKATAADCRWALQNVFTVTALRALLEAHPAAIRSLPMEFPAALQEFARQLRATEDVSDPIQGKVAAWMQRRMSALQQADRRYWRDILTELKSLRAQNALMTEGKPV